MPARLLRNEDGAVFGLYNEQDDEVTIVLDEGLSFTMRRDGTTRVS